MTDETAAFCYNNKRSDNKRIYIFNMRRSEHITDALFSLHWLRVPDRIVFKVAMLTFHALHGTAPP